MAHLPPFCRVCETWNRRYLINPVTHKAWNGMKCNFHQIYCYCCAIECECERERRGRGSSRGKCGMQMAIALMASSVSLCRHYAALSTGTKGAECDWAHSCWSIAKSIVIINTHAHTHTRAHTRGHLHSRLSRLGDIIATITCTIVILSTQNGRSWQAQFWHSNAVAIVPS